MVFAKVGNASRQATENFRSLRKLFGNSPFQSYSSNWVADPEQHQQGSIPFYNQSQFRHLLQVERRRSERSKRPFLMILVDISLVNSSDCRDENLEQIRLIFGSSLRETDIGGWYEAPNIMGYILTEVVNLNDSIIAKILRKIRSQFHTEKCDQLYDRLKISSHVFPEASTFSTLQGSVFNDTFYPDLMSKDLKKKIQFLIKTAIDFSASFLALLCICPAFLIIAVIIKLTSKGPVFFKQERMGLNGKSFMVLKFRSMYTNCDSKKHQEYIAKFIAQKENNEASPGTYKLTDDPRITPVGNFLRKTSLDELPQFINVFKGDMSLVGPRPPIPYEYDLYDIWHRRRLLSCKPGITGLWQVAGRSRTNFDDMVRLDLKYINEWSLWSDLKILLKTPVVVIMGKGAY